MDENDAAWSGGNIGRFKNIRDTAASMLADQEYEVNRQFILDQLDGDQRVAFRNRFPDFEIVRQRVDNRKAVIIFLEGIRGSILYGGRYSKLPMISQIQFIKSILWC